MSPRLFTKSVPWPSGRPSARAFFDALRQNRTLREAVEQMQAETMRRGGSNVFSDGVRGSAGFWFTTHADTGAARAGGEFSGGKLWYIAEERAVVRRVFDALLAWGKLVDPFVPSEGHGASVGRSALFRPLGIWVGTDDLVAIVRTLSDAGASSRDVYFWPGWRNWFGLDDDGVFRAFVRAQADGALAFEKAGSTVSIRLPRAGARVSVRENPEKRIARRSKHLEARVLGHGAARVLAVRVRDARGVVVDSNDGRLDAMWPLFDLRNKARLDEFARGVVYDFDLDEGDTVTLYVEQNGVQRAVGRWGVTGDRGVSSLRPQRSARENPSGPRVMDLWRQAPRRSGPQPNRVYALVRDRNYNTIGLLAVPHRGTTASIHAAAEAIDVHVRQLPQRGSFPVLLADVRMLATDEARTARWELMSTAGLFPAQSDWIPSALQHAAQVRDEARRGR